MKRKGRKAVVNNSVTNVVIAIINYCITTINSNSCNTKDSAIKIFCES